MSETLPREIERKWLLSALPPLVAGVPPAEFAQGYLPGEVLIERVRRETRFGDTRWMRTVKLGRGISRIEVERTRDRLRIEPAGDVKGDATVRHGIKYAIDDDAVEVQMRVEQRTETVDEDHGTETRRCAGAGTVLPQYPLDGGQKNVQRGVQHPRIAFQGIAQSLGHREHPLAHRQARDDVVSEMGGGLDHAPGRAGGADTTTLAGVCDEEVMSAVGAARTGKAVGEDAAVEIAAKFPLGYRRSDSPGAVILKRQPRRQVRLHGAIEQRALGLATAVDGTAR
jgi:hypothetical protein